MLKFEQVSIGYRNNQVLDNITVEFPEGKITSLIGPNGCGKTTLLQALNGSCRVVSGKIWVNDSDLFLLSPKERARQIAFLPQVRTTIPALSVRVLVEHGRFPYMGFSRKQSLKDREKVHQAMEYANVLQYADEQVDKLSGGIRQRVFFAMVLAQDSEYIILDEPTTFLDIKGQRDFLKLTGGLKEQGKTVVMVLHDIHQAMEVSDHIILMKDRQIIAQGTPEECIENGMVERAFDVNCLRFKKGEKEYYFFE